MFEVGYRLGKKDRGMYGSSKAQDRETWSVFQEAR